ncbi:PBP1A family penicillin-binding protein [Schleiferilactobacillus harbinensis]|uniref:PBP1A family penicillin-binding protein n=1 Tax=Schleiferilactobacillus harbinensis TaxID=304207 RepID=A0A5P8M4R8_9LACO|nr:PBP1A family penicillin-binding protein [Schleiferilactobacillus harbinensis]QFR23502.1 PBP1A family penicillin-binding protein [Schleiferilactobacillus harbinensis]
MSDKEQPELRRQHQPKKRHPIRRFFKWLAILLVTVLLAGTALFAYYAKDAPAITQDDLQSGGSSIIYGADGKQLTRLGSQNRTYVTGDKIPQQLKDAVVSIEDRRFYQEFLGVDPLRIASAFVNNVTTDSLQGGSTITQQLVKLTVFSTKASDQTLRRKAQEAWLSFKVTRDYSKDQVLEFYINKVYMGNGIYGMATAAKYYFNKDLSQLSIAQTATLAGMPQAPESYDPYKDPSKATNRRNQVLNAMVTNKKITAQQGAAAKATAITDGLQPKESHQSNDTTDLVLDPYLKQVIDDVKAKGYNPYIDNLKIYTNVDYDVQKQLYDLANADGGVFTNNLMQTGVAITNPNNGQVVAMLGGRKLGNVRLALNRAVTADRSNGSTMKPIMDYGPAIEYLNWPTSEPVSDTAYTYPGTDIQLYDWDRQYMGQMTMRRALVQSRNVPAIRTLEKVGLSRASTFASGLGIKIPSTAGLSVGIGSDVSPLQLASAYSAFSNGGTYYEPQYVNKITTADGVDHTYSAAHRQAMKASTAYMITDMLKGVFTSGTATAANISGLYQAGKTGTTDYDSTTLANNSALNNTVRDSWMAGYTRHFSLAIWTGYDQANKRGLAGSEQNTAILFYRQIMSYLAEKQTNTDWKKPSDVVRSGQELYIRGNQPAATVTPGSSSSSESQRNDGSAAEDGSAQNSSSSSASSGTGPGAESSASSSTTENQPGTGTGTDQGQGGTGTGTDQGQGGAASSSSTNTGGTGGTTTPPAESSSNSNNQGGGQTP